jgi:hypothetical protein
MEQLGTLFREARTMGKVYIHTHDDGSYHCKISAATMRGVSLEFLSDHKHKSVEAAVQEAISKAKEFIG